MRDFFRISKESEVRKEIVPTEEAPLYVVGRIDRKTFNNIPAEAYSDLHMSGLITKINISREIEAQADGSKLSVYQVDMQAIEANTCSHGQLLDCAGIRGRNALFAKVEIDEQKAPPVMIRYIHSEGLNYTRVFIGYDHNWEISKEEFDAVNASIVDTLTEDLQASGDALYFFVDGGEDRTSEFQLPGRQLPIRYSATDNA